MEHIVQAGRGEGERGGGGERRERETKRSAAPQSSGLVGFLDGYSQRLIKTQLSRLSRLDKRGRGLDGSVRWKTIHTPRGKGVCLIPGKAFARG